VTFGRISGSLVALALAAACSLSGGSTSGEAGPGLGVACSRWNPSVQSAVLEAVVMAGGPLVVDVRGWMCGRSPGGVLVRVVFLHFQSEHPTIPGDVAPVVFEDGFIVAFGWHLLESQPDRYGAHTDASRWGPPGWIAPPGWVVVH
jgi:hypothetical protein